MDAPDTLIADPKSQPALTDPQMDTNKVYEQEHERPQQVSDNQPIQLAQNDLPKFSEEEERPEQSLARNAAWAKAGSYVTKLSPKQEAQFQKEEGNSEEQGKFADYDERGRWLAEKNGDPEAKRVLSAFDGKMHASDKWKTPYHKTFSNESIYATPDAPKWVGDRLIDKTGHVIADETPKPSAATHHIVQAPDGAKVAFPKGTPPDTIHQEMTKWWEPHLQRTAAAWDAVRNAATNAAQAIGLPSDMPEWQATSDDFVRDPLGKTKDVVGAVVGGLAHGFNAAIPSTPENQALAARAQQEYAQGNTLAAATTLVPLIGDGLAKAVKQAQTRDYSGSLGTALGTVAPFLTESLKGEGALPHTSEPATAPYAGAERRIGERKLMSPTEIEAAMKNRKSVTTPFDVTTGAMDTINRDLAQRLEKPAPVPVTVNASGESAASQEAINRVASQRTQGIKTYRVDSRSGNAVPVIGVDAADATAKPYEHIVQVRPDGSVDIQDSGRGARPLDEPKLLKQVIPQAPEEPLVKNGTPVPKTSAAAAGRSVHAIPITPAMKLSVMKEGQPIAKKDNKKRPFAAPQEPQVASNFRPSLAERMKNALS